MTKKLLQLLKDRGYYLKTRNPAQFEFNGDNRNSLFGFNLGGVDYSVDGEPALLLDIAYQKHREELARLQEEAETNEEEPPKVTKFTNIIILLKAADESKVCPPLQHRLSEPRCSTPLLFL